MPDLPHVLPKDYNLGTDLSVGGALAKYRSVALHMHSTSGQGSHENAQNFWWVAWTDSVLERVCGTEQVRFCGCTYKAMHTRKPGKEDGPGAKILATFGWESLPPACTALPV